MTRASRKREAEAAAKKDDDERADDDTATTCNNTATGQPKKKEASTAGNNVIDVTEIDNGANSGVRIDSSSADSVRSEGIGTGTADEDEALASAAFGSDKADLDEKDEDSNLADVEPEVGMEIDFRDPDYIWSSGRIVGVKSTPKSKAAKKQVTVQYDGWPPDWNEVVTWPSVRIAKLFTYTKRVRCFAEGIIPKKAPPKKKALEGTGRTVVTCTLWPCTVRFRMPHPAHRGRAEELLRLEPNVFVQPFAPETLPQDILCTIENNNGAWLHNGRLRLWKNENALEALGTLHPSFEFAYKLGQDDTSTPGKLPSRAMEVGSLLNSAYRVFKVGGEAINGRLYTGECADPKPTVPKLASSTSKASSDRKLRSEEAKAEAEAEAKRRRCIQRPPKLPRPLVIYDPSSKLTSEAVRLRETKRWGAAISLGGCDLFLGSFPTQAHAIASSAIALAKDATDSDDDSSSEKLPAEVDEESSVAFPRDEMEGQIADLNATRLEDAICALEKKNNKQGTFSLHDWTMQSIRYQAYLKQKRESLHIDMSPSDIPTEDVIEAGASDGNDSGPEENAETASKKQKMMDTSVDVAEVSSKSKRKQSNPRRLDLETRIYDPPR